MEQEISPALTQHIEVQLTGKDSNGFMILGNCREELMRSDVANKKEVWDVIHAEATSGNYDHLLQTAMKWFNVS